MTIRKAVRPGVRNQVSLPVPAVSRRAGQVRRTVRVSRVVPGRVSRAGPRRVAVRPPVDAVRRAV
ncbi:hypothetical protein, partial [Nocardia neocaledoniensis]|uniref:hypothetical protein n=1 Tax=Nocardia neocaledoniensis TaxID=236511 RepID=UPI001C99B6F2